MSQRSIETSMERLSTGKRINSAADDAAGVAISSRLNANLKGINQSIRNALDAQALFDTAEGAMQETERLLQRIRELAVQAANDTNSANDRAALDAEKTQLLAEIDRIAGATTWAGQNLLDGTFTNKSFNVGGGTTAMDSFSTSLGNMSLSGLETDFTPVKIGNEEIVNTNVTADQEYAHVVKLSGGGYVVAWRDLSSTDVKAQLFNENGTKIGSEITVNSTTSGFQGWGDTSPISALSDGGFVIVYQSPDASGVGQFGQIFDSSGSKVGSEFQINTNTSGDQNNASVSAFDAGGFVATWTSADSNGWGVFSQIFDSSGNKQGGEFQVNSYTSRSQWRSSVATLANGTFVVTWESDGQDGDGDGIFGQMYNNDGVKKNSEFQINSGTSLDQKEPTVKRLENDLFVVVWNTHNSSTGEDSVMGQIFDSEGQHRFSEFQINTTTSSGFAVPQVTAMSDGGFMTVWRQLSFQGGNSDGSSYGIYGQRFDSTGSRLGSEILLNSSTSGGQLNPSVAQLNNEQLISVWSGPGDGDSNGVIKQRFNVSGMSNGTNPEIKLTSVNASASAINRLESILQALNSRRASLGALSNRIDHIVANNTNISLNIAKSISRIEDADFAAETTNLAKQQILQQAAVAMLAQANASKQNILTLLQI
jgi:flagellin-like hook-associated protein FlgL